MSSNDRMERRDFVRLSASVVGSLGFPALLPFGVVSQLGFVHGGYEWLRCDANGDAIMDVADGHLGRLGALCSRRLIDV